MALFRRKIAIDERAGDKNRLAIGLGNLADDLLKLGQLREAGQSLLRRIELTREIGREHREAIGHRDLGRLLAYQSDFDASLSELDAALFSFRKQNKKQPECVVWAYRSLRALLMNDPDEALDAARQSRELADVKHRERDIIRAEWLLGWSLIAKSPAHADDHLTEALTRCRRINLIELEPHILLALARLHHDASYAIEALAIADRCEYRLVQADCHNVLARLVPERAQFHAQKAYDYAWCDGPPFCYKPALDEAEELLGRKRAPSTEQANS